MKVAVIKTMDKNSLLAHLNQRLIDELINSIPMLRRRPSSTLSASSPVVHNFKHLLLLNRLAKQSKILCGVSIGRRNESLFAAIESHDQDGRHAHIW